MATAFSLDRFMKSPSLDRARAVTEGLPAKAVRDLASDSAVSVAQVARIVGARRTLDRRLKGDSRLSTEESERLLRFAAVLKLAVEVFGDRQSAMTWLSAPKHSLQGAVPLDLLRTEPGGRAVEEHLLRAKHGFFA